MKMGNHILNRLARCKIVLGGHRLPAFQVCGCTGVAAAIVLSMTLAAKGGLSLWVMSAIIATAMATFLTIVMATKIISGEEQIIYYHHEIGVMLMAALVAKVLHGPVLFYLDITILGIGAFLACGRIGCLMVGCCHGRPFRWGIRYRSEHAQEGFAPYLVGLTLFPIQALESLWVLLVVVVGVILMWKGQPAGSALAWYTIAYGAARFILEFIRGDIDRPYTWGFSQGQWLSLWLMSVLVWAEWSGQMPFHAWHSLTLAGLGGVMVVATVHRKLDRSQRFFILHPHHVREVAAAIGCDPKPVTRRSPPRLGGKALSVRVECTSLGFQISRGKVEDTAGVVDHYTLSHGNAMAEPAATRLADLILDLRGESRPARLAPGNHGVFHLMLPRERRNGAAI